MKPDWVDPEAYPFEPRTLRLEGARLSYLDEGAGEPIVFVHGTPTWSFLWRRLVAGLRRDHRVVAPDHLGFGLSEKPRDADYAPAAHARRFEALVEALGLRDVTLVVHDFGGPIGLPYALRHPGNVRRLVLMNTWLWSNEGDRRIESASRLLGGPVGRFLYRRLNLSPRVLLPGAFADRSALTPQVHRHYLAPFPTPADRQAPWVLARELTGSNAWYASLWEGRDALRSLPMLVLWGMQDRLIPSTALERWAEAFPHAEITRLEASGHFVPEEAVDETLGRIRTFLAAESPRGRPEPAAGTRDAARPGRG